MQAKRDPARDVLVRRLRGARPAVRWVRPSGFLLLGLAAWTALDPDYAVPRSVPMPTSAAAADGLLPCALEPAGVIRNDRPRFRWDWPTTGATFDFVLLDEALEEVQRIEVHGREFDATAAVLERLRTGAQFHWLIETEWQGRRRRSAPVAIAFSR
jgi:hypothetical protein